MAKHSFRFDDYEDEVTVEEAIERLHTLLHRATRFRKLSKVRDEIYKAQNILISVEDAVSSSTMYPQDEYCTVDKDCMED